LMKYEAVVYEATQLKLSEVDDEKP
jgi:hypothetical protein